MNNTPKLTNTDGAAAIEIYIDQRDKLWTELIYSDGLAGRAEVILLKDRNDFVEAMFRFKITKKLFSQSRIDIEKARCGVCETFVDQLRAELAAARRPQISMPAAA